MTVLRALCLAALCGLTGCVGAVMEGARITKAQIVYDDHIEAARAGDPEAQFRVGEALCCSIGDVQEFYDTRASVDWLCSAAAQGYAPAAQKLGQIYSGDVIDGVRLLRRVAEAVAGRPEDLALSYAWLRVAASQGAEGADEDAAALWTDLDEAQKERARALLESGQPLPCRWDEVFPG